MQSDRSLNLLFAVSATLMLGYASIFTLLAAVRTEFGVGESAIGVLGASGFLAGFLGQIGLARYVDRGHTRLMLAIGLLSFTLGLLAMALAPTFELLIAGRLVMGLGGGCISPAIRRFAVARDPERAGESLGRLAAFDLGGFLAAPILASLIYESFGLSAALASPLAIMVLWVPSLFRLEVPPPREQIDRRPLRLLIQRPAVQASMLAGVGFYAAIGCFEASWAVFMADCGASQMFIGFSLTLFTVPTMLIAPRAGTLAQRIGPMRVIAGGMGVAIPCMALYGVSDSLVFIMLILAIHSVADGFTMPANQVAIAQASPPEHLAAGQGLFGATGLAVSALTAVLGGVIYESFGALVLYGGTGMFMALCLAAAWLRGQELRGVPPIRSRAPFPARSA